MALFPTGPEKQLSYLWENREYFLWWRVTRVLSGSETLLDSCASADPSFNDFGWARSGAWQPTTAPAVAT
jgi:hypothetical protein